MAPNFSKKTSETLGKRASYRCSNPDCRVPTIGPNAHPEKITMLGEAAHIRGARPNSKRYDSDMTDSTRAEITNGIWLCRNCHKIIDDDDISYPMERLFHWRELHEQYVIDELGSRPSSSHSVLDSSQLYEFRNYPSIIRRIVIDKPTGWKWRLTAELMRHLNKPVFRQLNDLKDGLYIREIKTISKEMVPDWYQAKIKEMSALISPLKNLIDRLSDSWVATDETDSMHEIHHLCLLIRDVLQQVVHHEERLTFSNVPETFEGLRLAFMDCMGAQAVKLSDTPNYLDYATSLLGSDHGGTPDDPLIISKTIKFGIPEGWQDRIERELAKIEKQLSKDSRARNPSWGILMVLAFIILLFTLVF